MKANAILDMEEAVEITKNYIDEKKLEVQPKHGGK
jgi:hypothetical protein